MSDQYSHGFDATTLAEPEINPINIVLDIVELAAVHGLDNGCILDSKSSFWCLLSISAQHLTVTIIDERKRRAEEQLAGTIDSSNIKNCWAYDSGMIKMDSMADLLECKSQMEKILFGGAA